MHLAIRCDNELYCIELNEPCMAAVQFYSDFIFHEACDKKKIVQI